MRRQPWDRASDDDTARVGPTRFECSARFWMGAYPRRWRELHADEMLGVLEEVYRADDGSLPDRLPSAEVVGLVRAGWGLRWREHPPFWRWAGYRLFDIRLPERYWWWVADDIRSQGFPMIRVLASQWPLWTIWTLGYVVGFYRPYPAIFTNMFFWVLYVPALLAAMYLSRDSGRRRAWLKHVADGNVPASARAAGDS